MAVINVVLCFASMVCAVWLVQVLGVWRGLGCYAFLVVASTGLAGGLLYFSKTGVVSWRNRLAGWLLPWTRFVGAGSLRALLLKNGLAALTMGALAVVAFQSRLFEAQPFSPIESNRAWTGWGRILVNWLTLAGWLILFTTWSWLLKFQLSRRSEPISMLIMHHRKNWPLVLPPILLVGSIGLRIGGWFWTPFLMIWIPMLVIISPVLMMTLVILTYKIRGKPIRWN